MLLMPSGVLIPDLFFSEVPLGLKRLFVNFFGNRTYPELAPCTFPKWPPKPDMVTPTFFLWEITQKFFFLAWGFDILAARKNNFCGPWGSQWGPGVLLATFRA